MTRLAGIVVGVGLLAVSQAGAAEPNPSQATVQVVRETGVAMWYWLADQRGREPHEEEAQGMAQPAWAACAISAEDLGRLLVPKHIKALPREDGWGHDLQYCLQFDKARPDAAHTVLAVRSPGRDGKFSPDPYQTGPFPPSDVDQDIVWVNGYFVRWPERKGTGE